MPTMENVDVVVKTAAQIPAPIPGVVVKITNQAGTQVHGQATTNSSGVAAFLLPAPAIYQARFYKFGYLFSGVLLDVQSGAVNVFNVSGQGYAYPQSLDPRICLASGLFRTPSGLPAKYVDLNFIQTFDPILLEGAPVLPERISARTDHQGYVEVPLIRFGYYDVTMEGMEDYQRRVNVPNTAAVNIGDLLFPVVSAISFDESPPYTVAVGNEITLHPHVFTSDLRELSDITSDVLWTTSDGTKLGIISLAPDAIVLRALVAGTYTLTGNRRDQSIVRIPNTPVSGVPISIVVTP
jgi:hypothetical protein